MDKLISAFSDVDFQWTAHIGSIWTDSQTDIPELQARARQLLGLRLGGLCKQKTAESPLGVPIVGQAGVGKTHLLSTVRRDALNQGCFFVLADMTDIREFWETILAGFITSLDQKIDGVPQATRLLTGLTKIVPGAPSVEELIKGRPPKLINRCNLLIQSLGSQYRGEARDHQDVVRALVLLASDDFDIQDRGNQWLQGLSISEDEAFRHGFMQTQKRAEQIIRGLSWLMSLVAPTVLALDQLDAIVAEHNLAGGSEATLERNARQEASLAIIQNLAGGLSALRDLTKRSLTVLSCLEGTWEILLRRSQVSMRDRFETPIVLQPLNSVGSIQELVELRLSREFGTMGIKPPYPSFPFAPQFFKKHAGLLPREVLKSCRDHQLACMVANRVFEIGGTGSGELALPPTGHAEIQNHFGTLLKTVSVTPLLRDQDEEALDKLIEVACEALIQENPLPSHKEAIIDKDFAGSGTFEPLHARLRIVDHDANDRELHYAFRFLEKKNHIAFQSRLKAAMISAGIDRDLAFRRLAVLRAGTRPTGALSEKLMLEFEQRNGRLIRPVEAELNVLLAVQKMLADRGGLAAKTLAWLRQARPVSQLAMFQDAVEFLFQSPVAPTTGLPQAETTPPGQQAIDSPAKRADAHAGTSITTTAEGTPVALHPSRLPTTPESPAPTPALGAPSASIKLMLGTTRALSPQPVELEGEHLKRHVAVLGGSGSGKTTLALTIVEQLLLQGIPVVLVDRKGDLCRYADREVRQGATGPLRQLLDNVDIAVFTPGHARGRPLGISLLPKGLEQLEQSERTDAYRDAAAALGAMLKLRDSAADQVKQAIMMQALRVLGESQAPNSVSVESLIELIASEDPTLLEALGHLDPKHCKKLAEHLQTTVHMRGDVLKPAEDTLSADLLFGLGQHAKAGKPRLSIISTKFLGDDASILFWVSQLLLELNRFASRTPSATLQAAVMFDEADIYLPATSKPPTKTPLESLLKRARSAGMCVMLATQSPGDLDYKCRENVRNWFVGLVKEPRALDKLKPLLSDSKLDATVVLPKQKVGQFFVLSESTALPVSANRNLLETQQLSETDISRLASDTR